MPKSNQLHEKQPVLGLVLVMPKSNQLREKQPVIGLVLVMYLSSSDLSLP